MSFHQAVEKFKRWAQAYPIATRSGEWECDYDDWGGLHEAALEFLALSHPDRWTAEDVSNLLYVIARDNESEHVATELARDSASLIVLACRARTSEEMDARWQLAAQLGKLSTHKDEAESLLLLFVNDGNEYVSRRALLALASLKSEKAEALAERAWESGHEYQRMAALWALKEISSTKLAEYIQKAYEDGRSHLVLRARQIEVA